MTLLELGLHGCGPCGALAELGCWQALLGVTLPRRMCKVARELEGQPAHIAKKYK